MQSRWLTMARRLPIAFFLLVCAVAAMTSPPLAAGQAIPTTTPMGSPTALPLTASATGSATPAATSTPPATTSPTRVPTVAESAIASGTSTTSATPTGTPSVTGTAAASATANRASQTATTTPVGGATSTPAPIRARAALATAIPTNASIVTMRRTNVRDTSFTIVWTTDTAVTGYLTWAPWGTEPATAAYDRRGASATSTVHSVTVDDLAPSTRYAFDIISGATNFTNGGAHFDVTTGPTLAITAPDFASGRVTLGSGSPPTAALVWLQASNATGVSAPVSTLVTTADAGSWVLDLGSLRLSDLSAAFAVTADTVLTIQGDDGVSGKGYLVTTVAEARAGRLATSLAQLYEVPLKIGWNLIAPSASPVQGMTAKEVCASLNIAQVGTVIELARWELGAWESHRCGLPPNSFAIEPGRGYFIRASRAATWIYGGRATEVLPAQSLSVGWNLISVATGGPGLTTASYACASLNSAYGAGTVVEFARWQSGGWEGHRCDLPPNNFTFSADTAYFVRVAQNSASSSVPPTPTAFALIDLSKLVSVPSQAAEVHSSFWSCADDESLIAQLSSRGAPIRTVALLPLNADLPITGRSVGAVQARATTFFLRIPSIQSSSIYNKNCTILLINNGTKPIDLVPQTSTTSAYSDNLLWSDIENGLQMNIITPQGVRYSGSIDTTRSSSPPYLERINPGEWFTLRFGFFALISSPEYYLSENIYFNIDLIITRY